MVELPTSRGFCMEQCYEGAGNRMKPYCMAGISHARCFVRCPREISLQVMSGSDAMSWPKKAPVGNRAEVWKSKERDFQPGQRPLWSFSLAPRGFVFVLLGRPGR